VLGDIMVFISNSGIHDVKDDTVAE